MEVGERVRAREELGTVTRRDVRKGIVFVRWESGNFGIYRMGVAGVWDVEWVHCRCHTLSLLTPTTSLVPRVDEEWVDTFNTSPPLTCMAMVVQPPQHTTSTPPLLWKIPLNIL